MRTNINACWLAAVPLALAGSPSRVAAPHVPFTLTYRGLASSARIGAAFVMPGETLAVATLGPAGGAGASVEASAGSVITTAGNAWRWVAPTHAGMYSLRAVSADRSDTVTLRGFVMVPATAVRNGYLNGYHIGHYPAVPLRGLAIYRPPRGFVEVTPKNMDAYVTPHLQLGEFVTKQGGGFPKYVVLDERLLAKLEELLNRVHQVGGEIARFRIMSGYRTPYYNHAIGNVPYSRHIYGAAADILVDDLNGDGRVDERDAGLLAGIAERLDAPGHGAVLGGVGEYPRTTTHGPFVHVDVRGFQARW